MRAVHACREAIAVIPVASQNDLCFPLTVKDTATQRTLTPLEILQEPLLMTPKQAAAKLQVTVRTLHRYRRTKRIRAIQYTPRTFRFRPQDIEAFKP